MKTTGKKLARYYTQSTEEKSIQLMYISFKKNEFKPLKWPAINHWDLPLPLQGNTRHVVSKFCVFVRDVHVACVKEDVQALKMRQWGIYAANEERMKQTNAPRASGSWYTSSSQDHQIEVHKHSVKWKIRWLINNCKYECMYMHMQIWIHILISRVIYQNGWESGMSCALCHRSAYATLILKHDRRSSL